MEKLPMCRICLVKNVRMFVVVNRNWQELYEKLTDFPFVTEDHRPILACFFCSAKLNQCYLLLRQCLKAEELFAQLTNEDYEPKPSLLINQDHCEFYSGFIRSPTEIISIVDGCQTESIAIKEELPAVCERLDDIIKPKEEHQSDEPEPENFDNSCLDVADIPPYHSESDLEDDVPLLEFKTEVEEDQEVSENKPRASETTRTTVAKKPKLDAQRTKLEDATTAEQTEKEKSVSKVIPINQKRTSKPYKCDVCQRTFSIKSILKYHICKNTGEKPYERDECQRSFSQKGNLKKHKWMQTGNRPYKCDFCQRSFNNKSVLTTHIRIHTGEKPFKCDRCQCSFRQNISLQTHIHKHTGEKPYKCDLCQRSYSIKSVLKDHMRTHTGENQKMVGWKVEGQKVQPVFIPMTKKRVLD